MGVAQRMSPQCTVEWGGVGAHWTTDDSTVHSGVGWVYTGQTTEANGNIVMGDVRLLLSEVREREGERRESAGGEMHAPLRGVTAPARKDT